MNQHLAKISAHRHCTKPPFLCRKRWIFATSFCHFAYCKPAVCLEQTRVLQYPNPRLVKTNPPFRPNSTPGGGLFLCFKEIADRVFRPFFFTRRHPGNPKRRLHLVPNRPFVPRKPCFSHSDCTQKDTGKSFSAMPRSKLLQKQSF